MPKILIIGPNFHNFNISIARAFEQLGWEALIEGYDTPIHPFRGFVKWRHKFSQNKAKFKEQQKNKYKLFIEQRFIEYDPDFVFILNGDILFSETLDFFRGKCKVALWLFDNVMNISPSINHVDHVDSCFCYEQENVIFYEKSGRKTYFLPQAYDPSIYYPKEKQEKDIDILFVGNLYISQKRIQYIRKVVQAFTNKKMVVIGEYKPWYKNPLKWLLREHRDIYTNRNIHYLQVNDYYNRARVVLNIHHEQQKDGANPKVFEISGAGAYQICDANPYIESLFPNGEVGLYRDEKELIALIDNALKNDQSENANKAHEIVIQNHTFLHRVKEMLKIMNIN
ncbi:glycosyltransferase [Bacteroidales bacterium OttesenSCG-928-B11]|nr:glycosyltransferase [Bacteroidales bacterium OttesenSCG-928-E04]MDL2309149.1 glycosyltransferase [Bacteroidales bacterium OttesenSCG-928-C03]MDL2312243.1 glycosyltransferase [Bacteroidales bacterium OttesenSCG-928-B11]